jgi:hypothetical protein
MAKSDTSSNVVAGNVRILVDDRQFPVYALAGICLTTLLYRLIDTAAAYVVAAGTIAMALFALWAGRTVPAHFSKVALVTCIGMSLLGIYVAMRIP